ncbi:brain protein 44 [Ogataea parapolymorpha DL-1]|uniref:Mitochondrial pyruvate carrier n=1 Tax=Ogataea parapolymorpha (strain ATCC 26012 / BCRC 20466 / JCM 22074 / NRRL Y-7560 / DL-1) TaxID=871575 RepID=W1QAC4_OGAPD|nr:brain protein 44 [Ogataea parapolymorpha DL-1]ESW97766.1 brain protein 44 [Ogataea parapolymorpha DL-1]
MATAFRRFLNSETGPRTVHFWAPVMKWSLVFAGANDMVRPVEKVSGSQQLALLATGAIWTRWSFVIRPQNMLLASVNFLLGTVAGYQVIRLYNWRRTLGDSPLDSFKYIINGTPEASSTTPV